MTNQQFTETLVTEIAQEWAVRDGVSWADLTPEQKRARKRAIRCTRAVQRFLGRIDAEKQRQGLT